MLMVMVISMQQKIQSNAWFLFSPHFFVLRHVQQQKNPLSNAGYDSAICQNVLHHQKNDQEIGENKECVCVLMRNKRNLSQREKKARVFRLLHNFAQKKYSNNNNNSNWLFVVIQLASLWHARYQLCIVQNPQTFIIIAISLQYLDFYWLYGARRNLADAHFVTVYVPNACILWMHQDTNAIKVMQITNWRESLVKQSRFGLRFGFWFEFACVCVSVSPFFTSCILFDLLFFFGHSSFLCWFFFSLYFLFKDLKEFIKYALIFANELYF